MVRIPIEYNEYTQEELLKMPYKEAIKGLNEKTQKFCEYFVEGHNKRIAMMKAGFGESAASCNYGYRLLKNKNIARYIQWLKARALNAHLINAMDLIDEWVRIAFADMSDFVEIHPTFIRLKPEDQIDGQLIKSIKSGRDGISIELYDKMKALDQLAKYCQDMPHEWKQKIEERRVELAEQEFALKKSMYDIQNNRTEDDGFMEALKKSAEVVWEEN